MNMQPSEDIISDLPMDREDKRDNTEKFLDYFSDRIKQDREAAFFIFLTGLSSQSDDPRNIFMKGETSIGKTHVTTNVLKLFPRQDVWYLGGLSPTAFYHDYGVLLDENGEEISFADKPSKETVKWKLQGEDKGKIPSQEEIYKEYFAQRQKWDEKIRNSYYRVNLRGKTLVFLDAPHPETFAKLLPILSHDKEEISYKFTDKTGKGQLRTAHVKIHGWPATVFCTTNKEWMEDFSTRSFTITPRTTPEKLRAAIQLIAFDCCTPKEFQEKEPGKLQVILECLLTDLGENKFEVLIPYSQEISEVVELYAPRVMRDFKHFCTFIKLNAALNWTRRPQLKIDESLFILATTEDLRTVMEMFSFCQETTVTGLSQKIIDIFHKVMEPLKIFDYETLVDKTNEEFLQSFSSKTLYKYVGLLSEIGWVDQLPHPEDRRKKIVRVVYKQKNLLSFSLKDFQARFSLQTLKEWLKHIAELFSQKQGLHLTKILSIAQLDNKNLDVMLENHLEQVYRRHYSFDPEQILLHERRFLETNSSPLNWVPKAQRTLEDAVKKGREEKRLNLGKPVEKCWLCEKPILEMQNATFLGGKPCHVACGGEYKKDGVERRQKP